MAKRAAGFLIFRVMNDEVHYLLLKASYGTKHWTPPKGHVDSGEDDFTTALRETKEEAGYVATDLTIYTHQRIDLFYKVKGKDKVVVYWLAKLNNPHQEPVLSEEHTEFKWLAKPEATALSGFKDFENMLNTFHDCIPKLIKK